MVIDMSNENQKEFKYANLINFVIDKEAKMLIIEKWLKKRKEWFPLFHIFINNEVIDLIQQLAEELEKFRE